MAWLACLRMATGAAFHLKTPRPSLRCFGSAAAMEIDYDYDYDYDYEHDGARFVEPRTDAAGSVPDRGVHWVLIGEPGPKRHLCAQRLSKLLDVPHISMGTIARQELNPNSSLYKQLAHVVNEGKIVPEAVIFALLAKRLEEGYYRGETGFILDGVPRTRIQAEILDQITDIDLVVNFKCTEEQLPMDRNRKNDSFCSVQEIVTVGNSHVYSEQGRSLEDYYRKQRKLLDFKASGAPGDTWQGLLAMLHLQQMNTLSSTKTLAARFHHSSSQWGQQSQ